MIRWSKHTQNPCNSKYVVLLLQKKALVVRGPSDVRNKELIFMQFSHNETEEDFSALPYMLFGKFSDLIYR